MSANTPFTIVKPAGLLGEEHPGGASELVVGHDDTLITQRKLRGIPRSDVAEVIVQVGFEVRHPASFRLPAGGEQQSVATPQAAREWARPPCRPFKIQSWLCLGSALARFPNPNNFLELRHWRCPRCPPTCGSI
jgi:hypothetical protein